MTNRQAAIKVIKKLRSKGFKALLAGGCVRDMLLGRNAKDYDVATDALPEEVAGLFRRNIMVGAKFGVVIVMIDDQQVEVATFRSEAGYADGRHPGKVEFTNAKEDALRRDFTINGMFFDPMDNEVIDYVKGRADLEKGVIRTIGDARERFGEDYLRMLRAVRFSTQLRFSITKKTFSAVRKYAGKITQISGERICMELEGLLTDPNRSAGMKLLIESGLWEEIFPGFTKEQMFFGADVLGWMPKRVDFALALACVFAGCESDFALEKCEVLKLSRNQTKQIRFLLCNRAVLLDEDISLGRLKLLLAKPYFEDLYSLQRGIQKAKSPGRKSIEPLIRLRRRIKALGDVELRPERLLDGHELMRLGAPSGPMLGQLTEELYIAQLEGIIGDKAAAEEWVRKWLDKHKAL